MKGWVSGVKSGVARHKHIPLVEPNRMLLIPPAVESQHRRNYVYPGSSLETQCPNFLLKAVHVSLLYEVCSKISDCQRKNGCSA